MGIADRDYYREEKRAGPGFMAQLTPVVKWLLIVNLAIFFLDYLILPLALGIKVDQFRAPPLVHLGAFTMQSAIFEGKIWEFLTFQFLHGSLAHVVFNCMGLFFFGPWMERWWGSRKFIIFYLLCGAAGAVFFSLLVQLGLLPNAGYESPLVGASAGIYGIFIGVAVIAPSMRVALLFPPIELSMRQLAMALMAISVGSIILKWGGNEGGEAGHLGGAILGFILVRFPHLLGSGDVEIFKPKVFSRTVEPKPRSRTALRREQDAELDRILDKISAQGFQSLTDEEKATLHKISELQKNNR